MALHLSWKEWVVLRFLETELSKDNQGLKGLQFDAAFSQMNSELYMPATCGCLFSLCIFNTD